MDTIDQAARDRALMAGLVAGQEDALDALMELYGPSVIRFLHQMLRNEDDANDLAQETFVRVYKARDSYRPDHPFSTWMFTIAANLARNQIRWRSRHQNVSMDDDSGPTGQTIAAALPSTEPSPHDSAVCTESHDAVRAAIQGLPDDLREAVLLCEWEDLPVAEAAAVLGTTPKSVESRLYRARKQLKEQLMEWLAR